MLLRKEVNELSNDFLTQEEIDALLRGEEPEPSEAQGESGDSVTQAELSDLEKDTLAEVGNISMGSAATALSTLVNRRVWITVPSVEMSTMQEVVQHYPIPCVIVRVEYVQGLQGANMLIIRERDAAIIADLMMGGDGTNPPETLDELHLSAVEEAMNQMMGASATAMGQMFGELIDISPPVTEHERVEASRELATVKDPLIQVSFRIEIEDLVDSELVQLVDFSFGRSMVRRLLPDQEDATTGVAGDSESAATQTLGTAHETEPEESSVQPAEAEGNEKQEKPSVKEWQPRQMLPSELALNNVNIALIKNIPVNVRAILGRSRMPIEQILRLSHGSLIELDRFDGEPIEILANDTLVAKGEVVVVGEQFGVRITEIATQAERINSVGR